MTEETAKRENVFDSDRQHLADVYAKALVGVGQKKNNFEQLVDELDSFVLALRQLSKLQSILESPRVLVADKQRILNKILTDQVSKEFANFVRVLSANGRFDCLYAVQSSIHKFADAMAGRVQVTLTTAESVDESSSQKIKARLAKVLGKSVQLTSKVDPKIIGGLVIRVGDTVYDASISNQLRQVSAAAIGRANQEIRQSLDRFAMEA